MGASELLRKEAWVAEWWTSYKKHHTPRKKNRRRVKLDKPGQKPAKDRTKGRAVCQKLRAESDQEILNQDPIYSRR